MIRRFREWAYKKRGALILPIKILLFSTKSDTYKVMHSALTSFIENIEEDFHRYGGSKLLLLANNVAKEDFNSTDELTEDKIPKIVSLIFKGIPVIGSAYSTATIHKNKYRDTEVEISFRPVLIYGFTKYGFLIYDPAHPFRMFVKDEEIEDMFAEYSYLKKKV